MSVAKTRRRMAPASAPTYGTLRQDARRLIDGELQKAEGEPDKELARLCVLAGQCLSAAASVVESCYTDPQPVEFAQRHARIEEAVTRLDAALKSPRYDEFVRQWPATPGTAFSWFGDAASSLNAVIRFAHQVRSYLQLAGGSIAPIDDQEPVGGKRFAAWHRAFVAEVDRRGLLAGWANVVQFRRDVQSLAHRIVGDYELTKQPAPATDEWGTRIAVDVANGVVRLDGENIAVTTEQAAVVKNLIDARGGIVRSRELVAAGGRGDLFIKRLPENIRRLIGSRKGAAGGFWLTLPCAIVAQ